MQKVDLRSSKRVISAVSSYISKKDSSIWFRLDYVQVSFDDNKRSDSWKLIPIKEIKSLSVSKKSLGSEFEKLKDEEICQVLLGKSILMTTSLGD